MDAEVLSVTFKNRNLPAATEESVKDVVDCSVPEAVILPSTEEPEVGLAKDPASTSWTVKPPVVPALISRFVKVAATGIRNIALVLLPVAMADEDFKVNVVVYLVAPADAAVL